MLLFQFCTQSDYPNYFSKQPLASHANGSINYINLINSRRKGFDVSKHSLGAEVGTHRSSFTEMSSIPDCECFKCSPELRELEDISQIANGTIDRTHSQKRAHK